jgi:hypothetical protein
MVKPSHIITPDNTSSQPPISKVKRESHNNNNNNNPYARKYTPKPVVHVVTPESSAEKPSSNKVKGITKKDLDDFKNRIEKGIQAESDRQAKRDDYLRSQNNKVTSENCKDDILFCKEVKGNPKDTESNYYFLSAFIDVFNKETTKIKIKKCIEIFTLMVYALHKVLSNTEKEEEHYALSYEFINYYSLLNECFSKVDIYNELNIPVDIHEQNEGLTFHFPDINKLDIKSVHEKLYINDIFIDLYNHNWILKYKKENDISIEVNVNIIPSMSRDTKNLIQLDKMFRKNITTILDNKDKLEEYLHVSNTTEKNKMDIPNLLRSQSLSNIGSNPKTNNKRRNSIGGKKINGKRNNKTRKSKNKNNY